MTNLQGLQLLQSMQRRTLGLSQELDINELQEPHKMLDSKITDALAGLDTAITNLEGRVQPIDTAEVVDAINQRTDAINAIDAVPAPPAPAPGLAARPRR